MRVRVTPRHAEIQPGRPTEITIAITNDALVIAGYRVRVLGADPEWVDLDSDQISMFPDETRTVRALITAPAGIPAGTRRIAVQVREQTPPHASTIAEVDLTVPAAAKVQVRVDPAAVTAGRTGAFSVIVENKGNTVVDGYLDGDDEESKVEFEFSPERVVLTPGEHAVVDMRIRARRRVFGALAVRVLSIYFDTRPSEPYPVRASGRREPADGDAGPRDERAADGRATFIQKSVFGRGVLSLIGLLAAITVFAIVITIALSQLVGQSTADRNLALQVAEARNSAATGDGGGLRHSHAAHLRQAGARRDGECIHRREHRPGRCDDRH